MKIAIIGVGFVGLTTALGLCEKGHTVACVDVEQPRVDGLMAGKPPFYEPEVEPMLQKALTTGRFEATTDLAYALEGADVSIIAVGTPSTEEGIDLTYIRTAAQQIGALLSGLDRFHVVTVKSTVVPGTVDTHVKPALEEASGLVSGDGFGLAMNPEFLREGCAVEDFMQPDRLVIGADDTRSAEVLKQMYTGFDCPVIVTSTRNAEMIKYASNALLATLISYANEITNICERVDGLSEDVVMNGVFEDKRFWCQSGDERLRPGLTTYLRGGIGYGGSCFPKDVRALWQYAKQTGYSAPMLGATLAINDERASTVISHLRRHLGGELKGKNIAMVGVAFKPGTDDIRESPSLRLIKALNAQGAHVVMHDPVVTAQAVEKSIGLKVEAKADLAQALNGADGAIIATAWPEYAQADWQALTHTMNNPVVFDGRQVIPPHQQGKGFTYFSTGTMAAVKQA